MEDAHEHKMPLASLDKTSRVIDRVADEGASEREEVDETTGTGCTMIRGYGRRVGVRRRTL